MKKAKKLVLAKETGGNSLVPRRSQVMRFLGCVFALLLLISVPAPSLAGEASASPSSSASILPFSADDPSFCHENASRLPASTEQIPPPLPAVIVPPGRCGACSSVYCAGARVDSVCYTGGSSFLICLNAGVCTADGSVACYCGGPS
jgi:hypothetical protein